MTGRKVERSAPATYLSVPVRPAGVSPLMPPHSQGAERRPEHRAGQTGSRWGLRILVLGGLAGAAWLLIGATAQAADRDPADGGSFLGSSLHGSVVDRVLEAAAQQPQSDVDPGTVSAWEGSDLRGADRESTATPHLPGDAVDARQLEQPLRASVHDASTVRAAGSGVAYHRLPIAADIEARRHDAEAPTVSPD